MELTNRSSAGKSSCIFFYETSKRIYGNFLVSLTSATAHGSSHLFETRQVQKIL